MSAHPLGYWCDVVAELANRRLPQWRDRLGRDVDYKLTDMRMLAELIHRADVVMDTKGALDMAERGFLRMELPWQVEWNVRQSRGSRV